MAMNDPLIGRRLANFVIESPLGRGGMAQVYLGKDIQLDRPVAIKVIDARYQANPAYARRFVDEARMMARWRNENIIQVYYADQQDGLYYYVMEYIKGASLETILMRYLTDGELMPHEEVIRIGRSIGRALDYAHLQQVVHRDVKPSNVMIEEGGRVVLADFGLALDTNQGSLGEVFGSPHYIAPEQARRSADATPASDIYSLGVMLYEMIVGTVPFDDPSAATVAIQHITLEPPKPTEINPALSQAIEDVLMKALSKHASDRYPTASALLSALEAAIAEADKPQASVIMPPTNRAGKAVPKISHVSISERVATELKNTASSTPEKPKFMETTKLPLLNETAVSDLRRTSETLIPTPTPVELPPAQPTPSAPKVERNRGLLIGLATAVIVVVIAVIALLLSNQNNNTEVVAEIPTLVVSSTPTETLTPSPTTEIIPTNTAEPVVIVPTNTVEAVVVVPSNTPEPIVVVPTNTVEAVVIVPTNTPEPVVVVPTTAPATAIAFPDGVALDLIYNSTGFYVRNTSADRSIQASRLGFVGVDANGNYTANRYNGSEWARFYGTLERNNGCDAIEITQSQLSRPSCRTINATTNAMAGDDRIFWTGTSATAFAIFWDNAEIARCPLDSGFCTVRVSND